MEREGGKKKDIEREMWRDIGGVMRDMKIEGERRVGGKRDRRQGKSGTR